MKPYFDDGKGHVIYLGDCREILPELNGTRCDLVVTDPPYGVAYDGGTVEREKLVGDHSPSLYGDALPLLKTKCAPHCALYLFYADGDSAVVSAVVSAGFEVRNTLIWNKQTAQFGALAAQYKQKHEPFLYCHLKNARHGTGQQMRSQCGTATARW